MSPAGDSCLVFVSLDNGKLNSSGVCLAVPTSHTFYSSLHRYHQASCLLGKIHQLTVRAIQLAVTLSWVNKFQTELGLVSLISNLNLINFSGLFCLSPCY